MKAIRLINFGRPEDAFRVEEIELPPPSEHEVRLEILRSPINPADLNIIAGTYGELPDLPATIGNEGVGRVVRTGTSVSGLKPGDLAATTALGNWCSHRNVEAGLLIRLPASVDIDQASMICVNPPTALAMLRDFAELKPGDWIVQNAANSGVGRCVIQIARSMGLRSLNVVRRGELIPELEALGGDRVVTEETDLRKEGRSLMDGRSAKLALNAVGGASALNLANALLPGGTHVTYGAMGRQPLKIPNGLLIFRQIEFRGFWLRQWLSKTPNDARDAAFAGLAGLIASGQLNVPVHAVFPITRAHDAVAAAGEERRSGKILLDLTAA